MSPLPGGLSTALGGTMFNPFSMLGGFVTTALISLAVSIFYKMDAFGTILFVSLGWFTYGKIALAMFFTQGYGVKRGVTIVLGMPLVIAVVVAAISCVVFYLLWLTYQLSPLHPHTIANLRAFGWSVAGGVATAICHWYFWARDEYFYESEYNVRVACGVRGDSPEATEAMVAEFRNRGIVR